MGKGKGNMCMLRALCSGADEFRVQKGVGEGRVSR